jgi:uncharacterized phage protein (TIGR01671 family)
MSRIIKFRAWFKDERLMFNWIPEFFSDMSPVTSYGSDFPDNEDMVLMQFTGLLDKQGKEIYEGDIIKILETSLSWITDWMFTVKWRDTLSTYCLYRDDDLEKTGTNCQTINYYTAEDKRYEVIGNIYESPELLEDN